MADSKITLTERQFRALLTLVNAELARCAFEVQSAPVHGSTPAMLERRDLLNSLHIRLCSSVNARE
jgi:hypothetical protein